MNLLFVCSKNQWRSPTAEKIFDKYPHNARSAGTASSAKTRLTEKVLSWADIVFVMEKRHKIILWERFGSVMEGKKVVVLDIPDDYQYMDEELVEMLKRTVTPYLN